MKVVFAIEGLDRLGKSTLIDGIKNREGFFQVIHFGKPEKLAAYLHCVGRNAKTPTRLIADAFSNVSAFSQQQIYQEVSFRNSMIMAQSGARLIFDRWHLGECVYAPLYRAYSGDYVFELEKNFQLDIRGDIRLILLTEDFARSNHFVTDGKSFNDSKRQEEQLHFIKAFHQSIIPDKRMINVTNPIDGSFRDAADILEEALS